MFSISKSGKFSFDSDKSSIKQLSTPAKAKNGPKSHTAMRSMKLKKSKIPEKSSIAANSILGMLAKAKV